MLRPHVFFISVAPPSLSIWTRPPQVHPVPPSAWRPVSAQLALWSSPSKRAFYSVHCRIPCQGLCVYCLMYVTWQLEGNMTITLSYSGDSQGLERGQFITWPICPPRDGISGLEPRESCLRLAYMFVLCRELSPSFPTVGTGCLYSPVKRQCCFFLAHRLQDLERQEPNSALLLHLQKYQPSLETHYSCAPQMLTESRGCIEQQGTAWAKETR